MPLIYQPIYYHATFNQGGVWKRGLMFVGGKVGHMGALLLAGLWCVPVASFTPLSSVSLQSPLWARVGTSGRVAAYTFPKSGLSRTRRLAVALTRLHSAAVPVDGLDSNGPLLRNEGFRIEQRHYSKFLQSAAWLSWWSQVILNVVSGVILFFAGSFQQSSLGARAMAANGYLFAASGLGLGALSVFWTWGFTGVASRLRKTALEPAAVLAMIRRVVRTGIFINCLGLLSSLIGAEQFVGTLVAKVLSQQGLAPLVLPMGYTGQSIAPPTVQPLDIFVIQANTNTLLSHFISLIISLVLLQRYSRLHRTLED